MTTDSNEFLSALQPIVESLGASIIELSAPGQGDQPISWNGEIVGYLRLNELHGALERVVASVERELDSKLEDLPRAGKQMAVRRLDEHGAFLLRGAVEDVAAKMSVSKVTLYSYLNAIERSKS